MKNVKVLVLLILGILVLNGCDTIGTQGAIASLPQASDFDEELDYFEAKLDYFQIRYEMLEVRFSEITAESESLNIIRLESRDLLELIYDSNFEFESYMIENFEAFCIEDGGEFANLDEGYHQSGGFSCNHFPPYDLSPTRLRREQIRNQYWDTSWRLYRIIYSFFGESLADFENRLDELEIWIDELVEELDKILADEEMGLSAELLLEIDTVELLSDEKIFGRILEFENSERFTNLKIQARNLIPYLDALQAGIITYTLDNPDEYPNYCADFDLHTPDCPQYYLLEVRLRHLGRRLNIIKYPFGVG